MKTLILAMLGLAALASTAYCVPAHAHSWYDSGCCSGKDCMPAPDGVVRRVPGGYQVEGIIHGLPIKQMLKDGVPNIHKSHDEDFHVCIGQMTVSDGGGMQKKGYVRCLYIPEFGA